jgi:hypothetical protein
MILEIVWKFNLVDFRTETNFSLFDYENQHQHIKFFSIDLNLCSQPKSFDFYFKCTEFNIKRNFNFRRSALIISVSKHIF